ncbi:MAG TPA: VWA domain-containing protein [Anaerolineales bacterium]|nr:VWA domain-containing protein [Anaerolineales bacterium]
MSFLWPAFLYLLVLIPILAGLYIWILRRRRRFAYRYSSLSLVRSAAPRHSWVRRHLPFLLFLAALASLAVTVARPVSIAAIPTGQTTIILSIDVSRSMCSTDIHPNRLQAAEAAAISFVRRQGPGTQIGVVAFGTFAEEIQPPTNDQEALQTAIESLLTGRRTAIGSGILKSIDAISEVDKNVVPSVTDQNGGVEPPPVAKGAYAPDIVVLLTDGVSNTGPLPIDAAQQARDRGVRVYTIGFGTDGGSSFPDCDPQVQSNEPFGAGGPPQFGGGGGGGGFGSFRRGIDEATLQEISDLTGGKYYAASSARELEQVFRQLPTYIVVKHKTTELSAVFAAAGALLVLVAAGLSLLWHPLP